MFALLAIFRFLSGSPPVRPSLVPNCAQNQRLKAVDVQLFFFLFFAFLLKLAPKRLTKTFKLKFGGK